MATLPSPYTKINSIERTIGITPIGNYGLMNAPTPTHVSGTTYVDWGTIVSGALGSSLQQFLYQPMNAQTNYLIKNTVSSTIDNYINSATTAGIATDGIITDYTVEQNIYNNTYEINWRGYTYSDTAVTYSTEDVEKWTNLIVGGEDYKKQQAKIKMKSNLVIHVKSRAVNLIPKDLPQNEQVAIETLREGITEAEFRKYMKCGFLLVPSKSGKIYQVFRNKSHTKVWKGGKLIEEICVRLKNVNVPPTDNVIAFRAMIQIDEEEFRKMGNLYKMAA